MTDARQPRGTAFALRDPLPWETFQALVSEGEARGYAAAFLPEIFGRDALVALGTLAASTDRLLLGTGIIPMTSRTPLLTAMAAASVQERSGGRLILGLGTGPAVAGSLDRLRVLIGSLRRLFAGETVEIDGRERQLSLVPEQPVPIWISALGPRAVRLAGEVADGVLLNCCLPERVAVARAEVRGGAEEAGRDPAGVTIAAYVRASLGSDEAAAFLALQAAIGEYASFPAYARQFASMGLGDLASAAAAAFMAGRPEDVPEALIRQVCLSGDAKDARARLEVFRDAGADLPVVYPVVTGPDPAGSAGETLLALAPN
jgi:alkanesulfonate monooxygenase SsuD/methylene tetrahydromethanopterin reductase-like flavin-dependent oxidoreductase (luciferase family)